MSWLYEDEEDYTEEQFYADRGEGEETSALREVLGEALSRWPSASEFTTEEDAPF